MSSSQLGRLQDDLRTIRAVTGTDLPFDRFDVRGTLIVACCAFLPAIVGIAAVETRWLLGASAAPFVVTVLSVVWRNYRASHPSKAYPHAKRKEYRVGLLVTIVCLPLLVGFHTWATRSGAPADVANGCVMIFLGLLLLLNGLYESSRRSAVLPGIAAIIGGLMWPYCAYLQLWMLLWSCTGVALVGAAAIMHRQLVARDRHDAPSH
jgi:hypothetical protein